MQPYMLQKKDYFGINILHVLFIFVIIIVIAPSQFYLHLLNHSHSKAPSTIRYL